MPRVGHNHSADPAPSFVEHVLATLPALVLVTDAEGLIRYSSGSLGTQAGRSAESLRRTRVIDYVVDAERDGVSALLRATASSPAGATVGPTRVVYRDLDDLPRTTEVWAINRSDDREIDGIVLLLLPESAFDRFDQILIQVVGGANLEQTFGALAQALRYPPVDGESFFVMPARDDRSVSRVPHVDGVPGPPALGPWEEVWAEGSSQIFRDCSQLPVSISEPAHKAGFASVACYPIHPGVEGRHDACLVVWSREEGPPKLNASVAIERAAAIASLAISHVSAEAGLRDAAYRDALTGLGNRRSFFEALEAEIAANEQPAVLYIDLDGFKAVNDTLGHLAGDAVLRVAARRLASVMRPTDELARLGGDEFAVLCRGGVSVDQMGAIAERVVEQLNQPVAVGEGQTAEVGASVGIALGLPIGTPADAVLGHADRALYEAKARGRGRYAYADPRQEARA